MFSAINRKVKRFVLRQQKKRPLVLISDTTLRDGAQMHGVRLDPAGKVAIARALAEAGVHSIDCGFPAAGDAEREGVRRIAASVRGPVLSALSRTHRADIDLAADVLSAVSPLKRAITLFIGTSPLHRRHKHEMTKAQIIKTAVDAVTYAQNAFEIISFGPEDASRTEPDFLYEVYEAAIQAGALSIGFTDTVGILTPTKAADMVKRIQDNVPSMDDAMLGVHFHNDLGLATANSLACVQAGANIVQGTINGIGERAGNTPLEKSSWPSHCTKRNSARRSPSIRMRSPACARSSRNFRASARRPTKPSPGGISSSRKPASIRTGFCRTR
jgi:2-isopropylmalate synthase